MAYVLWKVVIKKYSRFRLGLTGPHVTPTGRRALTYDHESWNLDNENCSTKFSRESSSSSRESRPSKAQYVKKYLKKCKDAVGGKSNYSGESTKSDSSSSWYIDKNTVHESETSKANEDVENDKRKIHKFDDFFQKTDEKEGFENTKFSSKESNVSPLLNQETDDDTIPGTKEVEDLTTKISQEIKSDVVNLVDKYFGGLYANYTRSRKCLIRQARDLLICEYNGCLHRFENEYCIQAERLLQYLKINGSSEPSSLIGWPLCFGRCGIIIHLGPLNSSIVRNGDCYVCVRTVNGPGLEVTLTWRRNNLIRFYTIAKFTNPSINLDDIMCSSLRSVTDLEISSYDDYDGDELPELLQNLLVSVELAIERVPLDELAFPCPQCMQYMSFDREESEISSCVCQCSCRLSDNVARNEEPIIETNAMFDIDGSIPHIDSDDDEEFDCSKLGSIKRKLEISRPKAISELPDKLLMSGINLPGTTDTHGRPIILCYAECISRAALNKYEIAKLLLYYSSIPQSHLSEQEFTVLLLAETEPNYKVLELLDKSVCLIANSMKVNRFIVWQPGVSNKYPKTLLSGALGNFVTDNTSLQSLISNDQAPTCCGGTCTHDQLEWVEFFKQAEPFKAFCKEASKSFLLTLSQLRHENLPNQITRQFLNHQCSEITKALESDHIKKLQKEGIQTLTSLSERSQWLPNSKDVKKSVTYSYKSFNTIETLIKRLLQLKQKRIDYLKELGKWRSLHSEAKEILSWTTTIGNKHLNTLNHSLCSATNIDSIKEASNNFERFFFTAWRQIEKAYDILDEIKNVKENKVFNFKEVAAELQFQIKTFRDKLEDTRERLEDSSRCFLRLDPLKNHSYFNSNGSDIPSLKMEQGAEKVCKDLQYLGSFHDDATDNQPPDKLLPKKGETEFQHICPHALIATSTPIKPPSSQSRRRSVSSLAFIYHCNHHAAGEHCSCYDSDAENSVSYKLKKKYIQTLETCSCSTLNGKNRESLSRKQSGSLRGIKEESVENILSRIELDDNECRQCDSGLSTTDNSLADESVSFNRVILKKTCSCQYYMENCTLCSTGSCSTDSNPDHTETQSSSNMEGCGNDFFKKNMADDIDEDVYTNDQRKNSPVPANSHLYCHASTLDLSADALYQNMDPKVQKNLYYIIKEMIDTERDYVKSLDYVIVNYIPELQREDIPQALRGHRNTVFGNVEKIFEFHSHSFLHELEQCEHNPLQVGQIFLKHFKKFYLYALYNKNKPKSDSLMSEYGNFFFMSKQLQLKDKMDLASYLLKPVQRMGKYALLLQQMMKACSKTDSAEKPIQELEDLKQAEEMVRFQLRHGNDLLAMDSIRECDVNLKEQGRLLRQNEFLVWEGRSGKKSLRQVFLFEELILFSKARRFPDRKNLDLYIYKNSIKMTDIGLTAKIGDSLTKFEIWFRKRKPNDTFTLQSMSEDVKKAWTEELSQLLWKQAIKNRAVRLAEMSSMGIGNKPCLDIRPSVDQISDRSISVAQLSKTAPRFRNSIVGPPVDTSRNVKRPHSVVSMSSLTSSSASSAGSGSTSVGATNLISLNFDSSCESPQPYLKSATLKSQGSTESGIIADISLASDDCSDQMLTTGL